jgi:hypothetical protein
VKGLPESANSAESESGASPMRDVRVRSFVSSILILVAVSTSVTAQSASPKQTAATVTSEAGFRNPDVPVEQRVVHLLGQMTLAEKNLYAP